MKKCYVFIKYYSSVESDYSVKHAQILCPSAVHDAYFVLDEYFKDHGNK